MTSAGVYPDGSGFVATATTFSVDCGCDGPAPTPAATTTTTPSSSDRGAAPPTSSSTSAGETCAAGSGVTVTSSDFPDLEGCLEEIDLYVNNEVEFVSDTGLILAGGATTDPQTVIFAAWLTGCAFALILPSSSK